MGRGQGQTQGQGGTTLLFGPRANSGRAGRVNIARAQQLLAEHHWPAAFQWMQMTATEPAAQELQQAIITTWVAAQPGRADSKQLVEELPLVVEQQRLANIVQESVMQLSVTQLPDLSPEEYYQHVQEDIDRRLLGEPAAGAVMLSRIAARVGIDEDQRDFPDTRMQALSRWLGKTSLDSPLGSVFSRHYADQWLKRGSPLVPGRPWSTSRQLETVVQELTAPLIHHDFLISKPGGKIHLYEGENTTPCHQRITPDMVPQPNDTHRYCQRCFNRTRQRGLVGKLKQSVLEQRQELGLDGSQTALIDVLAADLVAQLPQEQSLETIDERLGSLSLAWLAQQLHVSGQHINGQARAQFFRPSAEHVSRADLPTEQEIHSALQRWAKVSGEHGWPQGKGAFHDTLADVFAASQRA